MELVGSWANSTCVLPHPSERMWRRHNRPKRPFVHKYGIAQKEARESLYWLKLLAESGIIPSQRLRPLMKETEELFAVITGIILSAKGGVSRPSKRVKGKD